MANITIFLPENSSLTVKTGDTISFGEPLIKTTKTNTVVYNLASIFSVNPQEVGGLVTKKEGEEFSKGDVLAKKRSMLTTKILRASFHGKVKTIDLAKGEVELVPSDIEPGEAIFSPVSGKIQKIEKAEMTIAFDGILIFAKQGIGRLKKGKLVLLKKVDQEVLLSDIKEEDAGKILLGGFFPRAVIEKAFGLGVIAVLAAKLDEGDFVFFSEKKVFDASLLLIAKIDFPVLEKHKGEEVVVEGAHKRIILEK